MRNLFVCLMIVGLLGPAQAVTAYLTGSSSLANAYIRALRNLCGGNFVVYKNDSGVSRSGDIFTAKCSQTFSGVSGIDAVAFNVEAGSFSAIESSTRGVGARRFFITEFVGQPEAGVGDLSGLNVVPGANYRATPVASEGGFMDMEPAAFDPKLIEPYGGVEGLADGVASSSSQQVFGVAVSKDLYDALQAAQGIPSNCGSFEACQPTISRAQYASIVSMTANSAKFSINSLLGVPQGKLTLCRRTNKSGAQAASNQYFLNFMTGNGPNGGADMPADAATYGSGVLPSFEVVEARSTSIAMNCLNLPGYRIGIISLVRPYYYGSVRYVRLNRVPVLGNLDYSATARSGEYDFVYRVFKFTAAGAGTSAVIEAIDQTMTDLASGQNSSLGGALISTAGRVREHYGRFDGASVFELVD